jgi:hypothetical protein
VSISVQRFASAILLIGCCCAARRSTTQAASEHPPLLLTNDMRFDAKALCTERVNCIADGAMRCPANTAECVCVMLQLIVGALLA